MKEKSKALYTVSVCLMIVAIGSAYYIGFVNGKESVWDKEGWTTIQFKDSSKICTIPVMKDGEQVRLILVNNLLTHQYNGWLFVNQTSGLIEFREITI